VREYALGKLKGDNHRRREEGTERGLRRESHTEGGKKGEGEEKTTERAKEVEKGREWE